MRTREEEDRWMSQIIGRLLQVGVGISAGLVLLGAAAYLFRHHADVRGYHVFRSEPAQLRGVAGIARDVLTASSRALIQLGLIVLIATPIARVGFSLVTFMREKDRAYTIFTLIVLALLFYSLLASK